MRVAQYYPGALCTDSGVSQALAWWSAAHLSAGDEVVVLHGSVGPTHPVFDSRIEMRPVRHVGSGRKSAPIDLGAHLDDIDVLVFHEGWTLSNVLGAEQARLAGTPYLIMAHGVYEPKWRGGLRGPMRPRTAIERRYLSGAAGVHLFFDAEREFVEALAPSAQSFVAPTGYPLPDSKWTGGGDDLLWIGRYAVNHKGLDLLIAAMASLPPHQRPRLTLRGVDYMGGRGEVERLVSEHDLAAWVDVGGEVRGGEKLQLLLRCRGYVHPARWDCLPGAVLEALALGVPTLASSALYFASDLASEHGAFVSDLDATALGRSLVELATRSSALGQRGRLFVARHFDWDASMAAWSDGVDELGISTQICNTRFRTREKERPLASPNPHKAAVATPAGDPLPATILSKIRHRYRDNGWRWLALHLAVRAGERGVGVLASSLSSLERSQDLPGLNSRAYNRDKWDAYDWTEGGEEWSGPQGWGEAVIAEFVEPHLPLGSKKSVLEIGPGAGRWTAELHRRSGHLWLVDVAAKPLEICRELLGDPADVDYVLSDGRQLGAIAAETIDFVWSFDAFVHIAPVDQKGYLRDIASVLRPGGLAAIHHGGTGGATGGWRSATTASSFAAAVRSAGMTVLSQTTEIDGTFTLPIAGDVVTVFVKSEDVATEHG